MTAQSKFAINLLLLTIFLFLQCKGAVANAQTLYRVTIQQGVSVKMRDGVSVDESGYARLLTDGIVRARYRETTKNATEVVPGKIYKYTIDLWATANVFQAGHRIRLYVSSSNFPRFNRNLNTGQELMTSTRSVSAHQRIYHDRKHSSALILPLIPRHSETANR